jgi:YbgC/YbaW family acyl-CoA thioester hydrolase
VHKSSKSSRWSEHRLRRRVQFYELDSAGIVHFSWYFRYMEEAEHALWREAGLSIAPPGAAIAFPRVAASFDYHKPLRFEEEFDIRIRVAAIAEKSMRYTCVIERDGAAIATGSATVVCASRAPDGTMRSTPIPPEIAARFEVADGRER